MERQLTTLEMSGSDEEWRTLDTWFSWLEADRKNLFKRHTALCTPASMPILGLFSGWINRLRKAKLNSAVAIWEHEHDLMLWAIHTTPAGSPLAECVKAKAASDKPTPDFLY